MVFDFESATEYQKERLHKIAHNQITPPHTEKWLISDFTESRHIIWFFLTLDGERDVCEIGFKSISTEYLTEDDILTEFLDSLPITYYEETITRNSDDEHKTEKLVPWWHICSDGRDVESEMKGLESEADWGRFYGYPEWAIQAYVDRQQVTSIEVKPDEVPFSEDELQYLKLLPYTFPLDEERIREGIEQGKAWAARIEALAEEHKYLSGLSYRLEEVLSKQGEAIEYDQYRRQQGWPKSIDMKSKQEY